MAVKKLGGVVAVEADPALNGTMPTVAGSANGNFLVAWEGPFVDPPEEGLRTYRDIYARAFGPSGARSGDVLVNTEIRDPQFSPDVTVRPDGSYVVAYSSGVEDQLEGTFLVTQRLGANGAHAGAEVYSPDYTYYNIGPDVAAFADGGYVLTATEEENYRSYVYSAGGALQAEFSYGYRSNGTSAVATLAGDRALIVWAGRDANPDGFEDPASPGLFSEVRARDGSLLSQNLLVDFDDIGVGGDLGIAPVVKALPGGNIVVAFDATRDDGMGGSEVYVALRDLTDERLPPIDITGGKAGDQGAVDLAVLSDGRYVVTWQDSNAGDLGDASGSAIVAQLFNADGTFDAGPFLVNTATAGDQVTPTVAALGTDFVIAWAGPNGIEAQRFDADALGTPDTYVLTRGGTRDGSSPLDQALTGGTGPTSFYFDVTATSGDDRVVLNSNDVIVTNRALPDPDGDRRIDASPDTGTFDLDGSGPGADTVRVDFTDALRFLGTRVAAGGETVYAYGVYLGFQSVIEGTIGRDTLRGTGAKDNFLFDTGLGIGLGMDQIKGFGAGDRIVTTTALADPDGDGRIRLNSSDRLLFDTPSADGPSSLKIFNQNDKAISTLVYDTTYEDGAGQRYYVYAAAGDRVAGYDFVSGQPQ